jgi:hypothetical protein
VGTVEEKERYERKWRGTGSQKYILMSKMDENLGAVWEVGASII